ncbi:MAG: glycosyltransferase [Longimicrobiales bacterium]|nr:glycosyltransferase [Longimicrobiales bacterium]
MARPLISVLLPVRDGAPHLEEALDSLSAQTLADHEVVVVDDGSTDATPGILASRAARDDRIRVLRQNPRGIVAALERARIAARGRYLARMDADDVSEPRRLEAQLALLESRSDLSGCGCLVRYFPRDAVRAGARRYEAWLNGVVTPEQIEGALFVECPLAHPTFFLRAEVLDRVGGYRMFPGPEDYELVLRMWSAGHRFGKVSEVLLRWREGPDRLSRNDPRYSAEAFLATKVRYLGRSLLGSGRSVVIWGAGPVGKALSRALRGAGTPVSAFVDLDPRKIGQEIHGAPVLDVHDGVALEGPLHLAAVGQEGARERIVGLLEAAGRKVLRDFVAVA